MVLKRPSSACNGTAAEKPGGKRRRKVGPPESKGKKQGCDGIWKRGNVLWMSDSKKSAMPQLDPSIENPTELLTRLLHPLPLEVFMQQCWTKVAVAVQGPESRTKALIRGFMHDLQLQNLLSESPSERIHAWLKTGAKSDSTSGCSDSPPLDSVGVDSDAAFGLARAGAALYFRAPAELEGLLVPGICTALGAGCAGVYPGGSQPRGEIETFVAGRGHTTGWHTDFQHNFTIQLKGSKRWWFKDGPVRNNVRALTPHYQNRSNFEQQMKVHRISDPSSPEYRPPDEFFENAEEVTLHPGAVLYHPAGIWHKVESVTDDSISINVSLTCATWADLVGDAVRQMLWTSPGLRAPVLGLSSMSQAKALAMVDAKLKEARQRMGLLCASDIMPSAMVDFENLPRRINVVKSRLGHSIEIKPSARFTFSNLASLVELVEGDAEPLDSDSEDSECNGGRSHRYALHINFGNEDVASWLRVELLVPQTLHSALDWLLARQLKAGKSQSASRTSSPKSGNLASFSAKELLAGLTSGARHSRSKPSVAHEARVNRLLRVLCYCGYIHTAARHK